jgi:glycosyltransferase involved in cell wall biosynthesis
MTMLVTPLKPLEAMAMGKAVVGAAVGGLQELIRDGETGLLCRSDDAAALASALAELGAAPRQRAAIGARARRFVCAERDWTHLGPFYQRVYRGVMPPGNRAG